MTPQIEYSPNPVLEPVAGCAWADQMVLNPAIIGDPTSDRLHMLFRASGPWAHARLPGRPLPYPIFLGYAFSDDNGATWHADFSRPALAPAMRDTLDGLYITTRDGRRVVNYANGCIEDPRLFELDGQLYMTCACRLFAPGPYWEGTELNCCTPEWALAGDHPLGRAATENVTVNVLYRVDLAALVTGRYAEAFDYVTHLTDPQYGENRDVYLFPEKLTIDGRPRYVLMHRPWTPELYEQVPDAPSKPSMFLAVADDLLDFATPRAEHVPLAVPLFDWESDRIGGSWPPVRISEDEWLVSYHGKAKTVGYTQSFMILRESPGGMPTLVHRCPTRLMYAQQPWELSGKFPTPCLFTCSGLVVSGELIMPYGAADTRVGIARTAFEPLVEHVRRFDAEGHIIAADRRPVAIA